MNADAFLSNFAIIAAAPEGIAQVRRIVRRLALTGKTTSQETTDEPVSDLQERLTQHQQNETSQARKKKATKVEIVPRFEVPGSWMWVSIEDIASHQLGKTLNKKTMAGEPVRYLRSVNIQHTGLDLEDLNEMLLSSEDREKFSVRRGDLFVVEGGHAGRCAIFDSETQEELAFQNQLHRLRTRDAISTEFLQLILREAWDSGELQERSTGMTIKHLSSSALRSLPCPLPPLEEQERIVTKVNELLTLCDQLEIQQNHHQQTTAGTREALLSVITNAETEEGAHRAFNCLKIHFDGLINEPKEVDLISREISRWAVKGALTEPSNDIHPAVWNADDYGLSEKNLWDPGIWSSEVEEGHQLVPAAHLGNWGSGGTPIKSHPEYYGGEIPWLVIGDLNYGTVTTSATSITELGLKESSAKMVPPGTVFFAMYGASVGKTGIAGMHCCTNQAIAHCIPNPDIVSTDYLMLLLSNLKEACVAQSKGAAQPNISQTILKHALVQVPPLQEQEKTILRLQELQLLSKQFKEQLSLRSEAASRFATSVTTHVTR